MCRPCRWASASLLQHWHDYSRRQSTGQALCSACRSGWALARRSAPGLRRSFWSDKETRMRRHTLQISVSVKRKQNRNTCLSVCSSVCLWLYIQDIHLAIIIKSKTVNPFLIPRTCILYLLLFQFAHFSSCWFFSSQWFLNCECNWEPTTEEKKTLPMHFFFRCCCCYIRIFFSIERKYCYTSSSASQHHYLTAGFAKGRLERPVCISLNKYISGVNLHIEGAL